MKITLATLCAVLLSVPLRAEAPPEPERAIVLTIKWDASGPSIEKMEKKEEHIPLQRGMPQMWSRFYELRDANGDVHFSGALVSSIPVRDGEPAVTEHRVVVPDLDDARRLVIMERVAPDPKKGRKVWLEKDL